MDTKKIKMELLRIIKTRHLKIQNYRCAYCRIMHNSIVDQSGISLDIPLLTDVKSRKLVNLLNNLSIAPNKFYIEKLYLVHLNNNKNDYEESNLRMLCNRCRVKWKKDFEEINKMKLREDRILGIKKRNLPIITPKKNSLTP